MSDAAHLSIVELGDICARMHEQNMMLFTDLGSWARSGDDPARQRWFATACHRHAWHAELWAQRAPAIPDTAPIVAIELGESSGLLGEAPDADAYRRQLEMMSAELEELERRVDADLDPSTQRVVTLVGRDIAELLDG